MTRDKKISRDSSLVSRHPSLLLVGQVRRPHGRAGEVSVEVATDFPERFAPGLKLIWTRGIEARPLELLSARPHGDRLLLRFEGISSTEAARDLAGGELSVSEREAFPAPAGYYYGHEVEGFFCVDSKGISLGFVRSLGRTPAGPMLTVETVAGKEALVPFVEEMVREIDRSSRRIVLDLPEGLLDL